MNIDTPSLSEFLQTEADHIQSIGPEYFPCASEFRTLAERLDTGRFHLAVLGQFKRGKSTLINALLGEPLLPSSVIPLTAIPTLITHGDQKSIRIRFEDGREDEIVVSAHLPRLHETLLRYVSEEFNPKNNQGILQVEVTHPSPVLAQGVVLIDTPGIGSIHQHNTETTLKYLNQCDAALFLVSADPPITEVEVAFLQTIRKAVTKVFFVLNKVDYLLADEQETALAFFQAVLRERADIAGEITVFPVSAKQGLAAALAGDDEVWQASGMAAVSEHLIEFLAAEKNAVLREAVRKKALDLLSDVALRTELSRRALEMPLDTLEMRMQTFEEKIRETELRRRHAADILQGDRRQITVWLEDQVQSLRERSRAYLQSVAYEALTVSQRLDEEVAQNAVAAATPALYERELRSISGSAEEGVITLLQLHQQQAGDLIHSIRVAAAELFDIPCPILESNREFSMQQKPYWVSETGWESAFGSITDGLLDRIMPRGVLEKRIRTRLEKQIDYLVVRNGENLRWATLQNIDTTFRQFARELDDDLAETITATQGAIIAAYQKRTEHMDETAAEIIRLRQASDEVAAAISGLREG